MSRYCAKFTVHKGAMGAFQAAPIAPTWVEDDKGNFKVSKEGAILIEMAPLLEKKDDNYYYNWKNKVSFALGVPDIQTILEKNGTKFSLVHTGDSGTKSMLFSPGEGQYEGSMNILLGGKSKEGTELKNKIALSQGEWIVFCRIVAESVRMILGWDDIGE